MGNTQPRNVPDANQAKQMSDANSDKKYYRNYVECTNKIERAIKEGSSCAYCQYMGTRYEKLLQDKGYTIEFDDKDDWYTGPRNLVSWEEN